MSNGKLDEDEIANLVKNTTYDKNGQINLDEFIKKIYPQGFTSFSNIRIFFQ